METLMLRDGITSVSRIAFGAEPLGGYEWGDLDFAEIERAVLQALELGVNLFDTADCYGHGESEQRLGRMLAGRREQAVIASKFGVRFDAENRAWYDNRPEHIVRSLEGSLRRLDTDMIDIYQLHWPDKVTPLDAVFDCLDDLRRQGKIRLYGVTNVAPAQLIPHAGREGLASFSLQYSLAHRDDEDVIRQLCDQGLIFLSWGSLGQGILSGRYGADHRWPENDRRRRERYEHFHGEKLEKNLALVERLRTVAAVEGYSSASVCALRFILDTLPRSTAIVGVKSCTQIAQNAEAARLSPLAPEELRYLAGDA